MTDAALPDLVLLDDALVPAEDAVVSAFDRGVMYGESLFETLKVIDGAPCLWTSHRERLDRGCAELGLPVDADRVWDGVARLLSRRPVARGVLRIQVTGGVQPGGGRGITAPMEGRRPRVIASVSEVAAVAPDVYEHGVRVVAAAGFARSAPHLKSGNYLSSVLAKAHAESLGAFECLLTSGTPPVILEGSFGNVLAWDEERLVCPLEAGRLPGVTLGVALAAARDLGIEVQVRELTLAEVRAGGLLLTGSILGVCACSHLDGEPLADSRAVAAGLRGRLWEYEERSIADWRSEWTATT